MRYNISAESINGQVVYDAEVEASSPFEAKEVFKATVRQSVREKHGVTPSGIPFLVDQRTLEIEEAK